MATVWVQTGHAWPTCRCGRRSAAADWLRTRSSSSAASCRAARASAADASAAMTCSPLVCRLVRKEPSSSTRRLVLRQRAELGGDRAPLRQCSPQRTSVGQGRLSGIQLPSGRLPTSPGGDDGGVQVLGARRARDHRAQRCRSDPSASVTVVAAPFVRRPVTLVLGPDGLEGVAGGRRGPAGLRQPRAGGLLGAGGLLRSGPRRRPARRASAGSPRASRAADRSGALARRRPQRSRTPARRRSPLGSRPRPWSGPAAASSMSSGATTCVEPGQLLARSATRPSPHPRAPSTAG